MAEVVTEKIVRPIILAGGLGTRLRPRTNCLPKPLLPVLGRPLLWYALTTARHPCLRPPIVMLAYKADLIRAFFQTEGVEFRDMPDSSTMAEAFLCAAESDEADAFIGLSSDVLLPRSVIDYCLSEFRRAGGQDILILTRLEKSGHKKWLFVIENDLLRDIRRSDENTDTERVALILTKRSVMRLRELLPKPVSEESIPEDLQDFQSGWILLLKALARSGVPIRVSSTTLPVCNINNEADLQDAPSFLRRHNDQQTE